MGKENYKLYNGDCLEVMDKLINEGVKVDFILTDIPYGTTSCKWDNVIPFEPMWDKINKLIKNDGAVGLFGIEPFSSNLRISNIKNYRYDWYWEKTLCSNFLNLRKQPAKKIENICIFYKKQPTYNPQMIEGKPYTDNGNRKIKSNQFLDINNRKISENKKPIINKGLRYPINRITFPNPNNKNIHPTQKPTDLLEYLIKTYTNKNELVLDFTMGSGSTGVACANTNRKFIGIELDESYFNIAKQRIEEAYNKEI